MTNTGTKILVLLGVLALLIAGVSAAEPAYQIETNGLTQDLAGGNNGYYILNGSTLTLPLNITYICDTFIDTLITNTTVSESGNRVTGIGYEYKLNNTVPSTFAGATVGKEWYYQVSTGTSKGFNGTMADALTLNITNLPYSENPYNVEIKILAADLKAAVSDLGTKTITLDKDVKVYYLYQDNNEINEADWNMTIPLNATANFLTGENVPAGEYTIPWDNVTVTRGIEYLNLTSFTVWTFDGTTWTKSTASSVTVAQDDNTITVKIDTSDAGAKDYKLLFEGRVLGDVSDIFETEGAVNIADVTAILQDSSSKQTYIAEDRRIYGDVTGDGKIDSEDAHRVYYFKIYGSEYAQA